MPDFATLERQALQFEGAQRLNEARDAFDAALRLQPKSQSAAEGRARIALALKEDSALKHCSRALAFHDDHPERQLRMLTTVAGELGCKAIPLFEEFLHRHPTSAHAHQFLAELLAEDGAGDRFTDHYLQALQQDPTNKPLLMSYWDTLTRAGRLDQALESMDAHRQLFADDRAFRIMEINTANHANQPLRSGRLLDGMDDEPDAQLARGQHRLQTGDPASAAKLLEQVLAAHPDNLTAWALLELAWRLTRDPRHAWLVGSPPLYRSVRLSLSEAELNLIAAALRRMHKSRAQPIGQSVRGGTQTSGQLFFRTEPEIGLLTDALADAVRQFMTDLPAEDQSHPFLKHRSMGMAFGPSWSVRLTDGGYHAAHFHPGGVLSSACYIALPEMIGDSSDRSGWLEIGRPPPALGLDLPPLDAFEPTPGRLVLFPSFLFHGTRPFPAGERLTVAFDLVPVSMN